MELVTYMAHRKMTWIATGKVIRLRFRRQLHSLHPSVQHPVYPEETEMSICVTWVSKALWGKGKREWEAIGFHSTELAADHL